MDVMFMLRDLHTHATLDTYAYRYGLGEVAVGGNKDQKVLGIAKHLLENPKLPGLLSNNLMYEIVEDAISRAVQNTYRFDANSNEFIQYPQLRRLLLKDGFVIRDGQLIRTFDTDFDYSKNETLLESLLNNHQLKVAKGHFDQASNAFNRGDWAACNSQLRSYVEELLNKLAERITGNTFPDSHQAKIALSKCTPPLFYKQLNEWSDNGTGYFETFWKRLHNEGSHPGLSDEDDSIFRLNIVQISTLEVLRRYDRNFS